MRRLVGEYGKIIIAVIVALAVLSGIGIYFAQPLQKESEVDLPELAGNVSEEMRILADGGYYPYMDGITDFTITKGYKGSDGVEGFTREDALSEIEAYEYVLEDGKAVKYPVEKSRIKVYPFDESDERTQDNGRIPVDVNTPGRYSLKYVLEGKSGLIVEYTTVVLVDFLPEGIERQNESQNEGGESK